ncbi:MAG: YhdP family protein [Alphaproteobacteria bacterium]
MGLAALMVGGTMAGVLFAVIGLTLRLMIGPISLGPLVSTIEDYLNASVTGMVVHFDQAMLEWSQSEGRVDLTILGAKVFDRGGRIIAQAPKAELDFDAGALLAGRTDLRRFALIGMQLTGVRTKDGGIRLGFRSDEGESDLLQAISEALRYESESWAAWGKARSKLDQFAILNARIAFHDEQTGLFVISPSANLSIRSPNDVLHASLTAAVDISGVRANIIAEAELLDNGMPRRGALEIHGLSLTALAANSPAFAGLAPYALTLDFTGNAELKRDGTIRTLDFGISGKGVAGRPKVDPVAIGIENLRLLGRFDGNTQRLLLDEISIDGNALRAQGTGRLEVVWDAGTLKSLAGELSIVKCAVNIPDRFAAPVIFDAVALRGAYDRIAGKIAVDNAILSAGRLQAKVAGLITLAGQQSPQLDFQGSLDPISVRDLLRYWPVGLAEGARSWMDANISKGNLGQAVLESNIPPGALDKDPLPEESVSVTFPFSNVTAQYIRGMTRIVAAHGNARLSGNTFRAEVLQAQLGPLAISRGTVVIPDLHIPGAAGTISAHIEGKVSDLLAIIDEQPLNYPTRFNINPIETKGDAALDLNFTVPMLKDLEVAQLGISISARTTGVSMPLGAGRVIENGALVFTVDAKSLLAQGPVRVSGVPLDFKWSEQFATGPVTTRVEIKGIMDDEGRTKLGLPDAGLVFGPSRISLALVGRRAQFTSAVLRADLKDAEISVPTINWNKPAGQPATLSGNLHFGSKGTVAIKDFRVAGNGIDIRGGFSIDEKGGLLSAAMPVIRTGTTNDFTATMTPIPSGGLQVLIAGKTYDASKVFASKPRPKSKPAKAALQVLAQEEAALKEPLSFEAKLDRVLLDDGIVLSDFWLHSKFGANAHLQHFAITAAMPDNGTVSGTLSTLAGGEREVTVEASDAGKIVRGLTAFESMRNGTALLRVSLAAPNQATSADPIPDYRGSLVLRDFSLVDQPFFMRLFSAGSLLGPIGLLQGSGIQFTKLEAPFRARGRVIKISEGRASGPSVGVSFQGVIDRRVNTADISGTMVPLYGINSMLGAVPVLGNLLVSKQGEGIFGLTYSIRGDIDQPSLSVNPLSVLTPGIFRRIFDRPMPEVQVAPPPVAQAGGSAIAVPPSNGSSGESSVPEPKSKPEAEQAPP